MNRVFTHSYGSIQRYKELVADAPHYIKEGVQGFFVEWVRQCAHVYRATACATAFFEEES